MATAGKFDLRIIRLARVLATQSASGERVESWPEAQRDVDIARIDLVAPPFVLGAEVPATEFYAARESLSAAETIAQGVRQSTGFMKLRIKGRRIPIQAADRIRKKYTEEVYAVTGVWHEKAETVITCERVHQQVVPQ